MSNLLFADLYYILCQCGPLWNNLVEKRVLLTGCSGFIGSWMAESFAFANKSLALKSEMVGLCRRPYASTSPYIKILNEDVRNFDFPKGHFDYIIHAAGGQGADTLQTSIHGTERVIEFAKHAGVKRIVYASSGAVYANDCFNAAHAYGEGKRAAEMLLATSELDAKVARIYSTVGPEMDFDKYAIGQFIKQACAGGPVVVKGGKNVVRSYLYAADVACALWMILLFDQAVPSYNIGSGEAITIYDLADKVGQICGVEVIHEEGEYPDSVYVPEGPAPNIKLNDAIERTVAWYKEQKSESR